MKFTFTSLLLFTTISTAAQITFEKRWGGDGYQDGMAIHSTSDGGYIIAGTSTSDSTAFTNILLMKVDSLGDSLWTKTYGGPGGNDFPSAIIETQDGGFLISATTYSLSYQAPNFSDWWILRTDAFGDTLWTKIIRKPNNDRMWHISENDDRTFLACGWLSVNGYARATMIKFSETGDSLWSVQIGSSGNSYAQYCMQNYDGNYLLAGASLSGTFQGMIMQFDTAGSFITYHSYDKTVTAEIINTVEHLSQGGYLISAKTGTINGYNIWVLRTNDNWDTLWTKTFNDPIYLYDTEAKFAFAATADGGCIFGGSKFTGNSSEAVLYRLDPTGALIWTNYFGGSTAGEDKANALLSFDDGGFIFSGQTGLITNDSADIYIVRTDTNGNVTTGTSSTELFAQSDFRLFPNPCQGNLYWQSNLESIAVLRVFSATGKMEKSILLPSKNGELALKEFSSGLYVVEIVTPGSVIRKKVILTD
ncbi:MAG TPA: T9SS type A sorting domain-containing protein [Bacteroidia bacterium]|nr:T9SS type A sorting domain-containing protein [Bacteroidia bacterium]